MSSIFQSYILPLPIFEQVEFALIFQSSWAFLLCVKIVDGGLYFLFSFLFYFSFLFLFLFLFLEQLGLGFISHAVTSVTN